MNAPTASSRTLSGWLWRILLPSWRFFEAEDARFLLEARTLRDGEAPSAFVPAVPALARTWLSCVFAPEHNLRLFCHDLIERFVCELGERSPMPEAAIEALASYARVRDLTRYFVRKAEGSAPGLSYQLRLLALSEDGTSEELFRSPYYPAEA
jgi:hypothetical protein